MEMEHVTVTALRNPAEPVLTDVNWKVGRGEFWAVAGLVRTGKSDLMTLAAGIMPPHCGTYRVFGNELLTGFEEEQLALRLRLGLVFDGGQLFHPLTLAENIALPLRYHWGHLDFDLNPRLQALEALTGLERWMQRLPMQVNHHWRQRIGLARALALKPEILLLDSPLTGLDPRDSAWWVETISALAKGHPILDERPATVVVTGDNLRPWATRATHFAVLKDRAFFPLGPREELAANPEPLLHELLRNQ
jgi:ABC-type transporter Mla maintaining outer membrane lipid asymmetry ATPase subunit MlaF